MFNRSLSAFVGCVAVLVIAAAEGRRYNIGHVASPDEIRAAGISKCPLMAPAFRREAATQLRDGSFIKSTAQRVTVQKARGALPAQLSSGAGVLVKSNEPVLTVGSYWPYATIVWDYINRAMPYTDADSLTPKQVYSVTAYILFMNGIVDDRDDLNEMSLPKVRIPNRFGITSDPRPDVP
jgi:hypothetical protein